MLLTRSWIRLSLACCVMTSLAAIFASVWHQLQQPLVVVKSEISLSLSGERLYKSKPFTGEAVTYHANGQLATADQFLDGRREGYAKKWFADGLLGYESNYHAGTRRGTTRSWWYNSNLRSETFFVDGQAEGIGWHWYRSGVKFKRFNYAAGKPVGIQQAWRRNGKLFSNFEYKNGRIYGLRKSNTCVGLEDEVLSANYYESQDS